MKKSHILCGVIMFLVSFFSSAADLRVPALLGANVKTIESRIDEAEAALEVTYRQVLTDCRDKLLNFETEGNKRRKYSLWLALTGALAGAVFAPAVAIHGGSTTIATLFSGYSGFTNTAQESIVSQNYTREETIQDRGKLRKSAIDTLDAYIKEDANLAADRTGAPDVRAQRVAKLGALLKHAEIRCTLYELNVKGDS